ncbi:Fic family protein [bacterium]|nr:Fic family protein [bacterium]
MRLILGVDMDNVEIKKDLGFIESRLYVARSLIPKEYEIAFQETAHYISAHTSTAIEGNPLGEEEAMNILAEKPNPIAPDQLEKINLDEAYEFMFFLASDKTTIIDEGIIRTINSMILKGLPESQARARGQYRVGPSKIVDSVTRERRYLPPKSTWVPTLMKNFVLDIDEWIQNYPGPVAAALAHFGLISIHPFEDGNGRTARLIADMILHITDCSADGMVSVSQEIHNQLGTYYKTLHKVQGENYKEDVDVTDFIIFHTGALASAAISLEEKAIHFSRLRDNITNQLSGLLNERQVTGLMYMVDIGQISTSRYARLTDSSQNTALTDLNPLVELGLVNRIGGGKNTRYILDPSSKIGNDEIVD